MKISALVVEPRNRRSRRSLQPIVSGGFRVLDFGWFTRIELPNLQ